MTYMQLTYLHLGSLVPAFVIGTYLLLNRKGAVRATGSANGANALAIIIPCHRVIASDGSLGGYGGGLPLKKHLLALEKNYSLF